MTTSGPTSRSTSRPRVVGVSCLSGLGRSWRDLGDRVRPELPSGPPSVAVELAGIPPDRPRSERMAEKLMSRSAVLGHLATRAAITDAGWHRDADLGDVGNYMGVGASGGSVDQLEAMLSQSVENGAFSLERFGRHGLRACNPLYAFQLMNNFAMCHAAILSGLQGPNAALFSRGGGTVVALAEALFALEDDDEPCTRTLVGGADCALDPVTTAELHRRGLIAEGLEPGEGAAVLALSRREADEGLATIAHCAFAPPDRRGLRAGFARAAPRSIEVDAVVTAGWGPARQGELASLAAGASGDAAVPAVMDVTRRAGETLAASPALAWATAIALLQGPHRRVMALTCGIDEELGVVVFEGIEVGS